MTTITISLDNIKRIVGDMEMLVTQVVQLQKQDEIAKKRWKEIKENPSSSLSEDDLENYIKKRGIIRERMDN
ncbi:MAG TPA: hypothetical protein VJK51_03900 [Candidatus Nanoarchaeia archaeon]|nr:hypothetical protein [Candidatus Nanoarchaeia archaeon]